MRGLFVATNDYQRVPGAPSDPRYRAIARDAGFTEWEIDHCPPHLVKNTTGFQLTRLKWAMADLWTATLTALGRGQ